MKKLIIQSIAGLVFLILVLAVALYLPAGTFEYWQAWVFLAVFFVSVLAITLYLAVKDPQLLQRRVTAGPGAEKEKKQNVIQSIAQVAFIAIFIVPALDHRLHWSQVPAWIVIAGDALVVLGLFFVFLVFRENSYTSGIIAVEAEQKLVSTGPYAIVRHPMYSGALLMLLGVPLALGSWWGVLTLIPITLVIVWRLLDEEEFLAKNLTGYPAYTSKVKYRLLPYVY